MRRTVLAHVLPILPMLVLIPGAPARAPCQPAVASLTASGSILAYSTVGQATEGVRHRSWS